MPKILQTCSHIENGPGILYLYVFLHIYVCDNIDQGKGGYEIESSRGQERIWKAGSWQGCVNKNKEEGDTILFQFKYFFKKQKISRYCKESRNPLKWLENTDYITPVKTVSLK